MKKLSILSVVFIMLLSCNKDNLDIDTNQQLCDNGTHVGDVRLLSQDEVIAFGEECYTKIEGTLYIGAVANSPTDITDLSPLSSLTEIYTTSQSSTAKIWVAYNPILQRLNGLHNIEKADGLVVSNNEMLTTFSGLEGLTALYGEGGIHDIIVYNNDALENFDGLDNLTQVGTSNSAVSAFISIQDNDNLQHIDALSNLDNVFGSIYIGDLNEESSANEEGNNALTSYCGLTNLFVNGYYENVYIDNNLFNPTVQDIVDGNCSQ